MLLNVSKAKPTPRQLILKLLGSRSGVTLNAANAVRIGGLFGLSENHMRVTLTRLHGANLLHLVERGFYSLGSAGEGFANEVSSWRSVEAALTPWQGEWFMVLTSNMQKSDRKAQRNGLRALKLLGMEQLTAGCFVRPANFVHGVESVRERLYNLGLDKRAEVLSATKLSPSLEKKARALWQVTRLEANYRQHILDLDASLQRLPQLSLDEATKESYLVGDYALQQLVFDPLLPAPLIDEGLRQAYRAKVQEYDQAGANIWRQFLHETN